MVKFEDSLSSVENYAAGAYKVGDKLYVKKIHAFLESTRTGIPVEWSFYKQLYTDRIKMTKSVDMSLLDLYKIRAQQLRDKYDYLVLCYSGGSDSHNILHSFISNNIKLDEVVCDFPMKLIEQSNYRLSTSTNFQNLISEWFLTVKPDLKQLEITNPEIKISFLDSFSDTSLITYEESISYCNEPAHYATVKRWKTIANHVDNLNKGNRVALIMAVDKPIVYATDKHYGFLFVDLPTNTKPDTLDRAKSNLEYFYWTPDLPDIPVQQSKKLWNYLFANKEFAKAVFSKQKQGKRLSWSRTEGFNDLINKICYPHWNSNRHQVNKGSFHHGQYKLLSDNFSSYDFLHKNSQHLQDIYKQLSPSAFHNGLNFDEDMKLLVNFHILGELPSDW